MMTLRPIALSLFGALALAAACGDEGKGVGSGIDGSKQLGSLTDAEKTKLCTSTAEHLASSAATKDLTCKLTSSMLMELGGAAACQQLYDQCKSAPATAPVTDAAEVEACAASMPSDCTVTVAEYEDCAADSTAAMALMNSKIKVCDTSTVSGDTTLKPETPASCAAISEKCPRVGGSTAAQQ